MTAQDTLIWPLNCKPQLTSTFGEFRVGHFHAGIDLRTPDGEGMPIIAPRDGSIIRVRETPWGYGKVVYYKMDNGITAVFAHLSAFNDTIEQVILAEKYREKSNTAELWFREGDLTFDAGDTLAFSGSTGAGSPHLHFETRTSMDRPVNPMDLGYVTEDTLPPQIRELWLIPRSDNTSIRNKVKPYKIDGKELEGHVPEIEASGTIALAIDVRDRESENNYNTFGIHTITVVANSETTYIFLADSISYSTTRQIGLLYELGHQVEFAYKRPLLRLETPKCSEICMLKRSTGQLIEVANDTVEVFIEAKDYVGNTSIAEFKLIPAYSTEQQEPSPDSIPDLEVAFSHRVYGVECVVIKTEFSSPPPVKPILIRDGNPIQSYSTNDISFSYRLFGLEPGEKLILLVGNREFYYSPEIWRFEAEMEYELAGGWHIEIPQEGVYEPFTADDTLLVDTTGAARIRIDPAGVILRRPSKLSIDTTAFEADSGKMCIVRLWGEDTFFVSNEILEGRLIGSISALGIFALAQDSISPNLSLNIEDSASVTRTLEANIEDDLSGFSRDVLPNSYIDGQWIPTEYDPEKNLLLVDIKGIDDGLHVWRVQAEDICGNAVVDSVRFRKTRQSK